MENRARSCWGKLPILNQSGHEPITIPPQKRGEPVKDEAAIEAIGDRDKFNAREREGWIGFVSYFICG
jgi:sulfite oxidase